MELDDTEKRRILLEERYRAEVRLALKEPSGSKVASFLNSTLGLWLLSAVFLSGGGTVYGCWQRSVDATRVQAEKDRDEQKLRLERLLDQQRVTQDAVERLDLEISYRFSQALLELFAISDSARLIQGAADRKLNSAQRTFGVLQSLTQPPRPRDAALYPEYTAYALPTLMSELRRRLQAADAAPVEQSLAALLGAGSRQTFATDDPAKEAASTLLKDIVLQRWKRTAFHYVDCPASSPFC
jgi:hypothetical protein